MTNSWIKHPTKLSGNIVELIPLEKEHFDALYEAANDPRVWQYLPFDGTIREKFDAAYNLALEERAKNNHYPFIIVHKDTQKFIGSTRLFDQFPKDKKLEIGFTWIIPEYWATAVNIECKLLLLTFCFESLGTNRVQLRTDERNIRSRTAIQKIGGQFEGILRKDKILDSGFARNSAYFSIIDDEWKEVKEKLQQMLTQKMSSK